MNYVGLFFVAKFVFYSLVSSEKLTFAYAENLLRPIDIFFPVVGLEIAANLVKGRTTLERAKKLFLLPPLYFLIPLLILLISSPIIGIYTSVSEVFGLLSLILEMIFLLYTLIFSFTIALDFPKSGKKITELHMFTLSTVILGVLTFQLPQNNLFFNLAHTLPFLWASTRFRPKTRI